MCTVTYIPLKKGFVLTSSRDEKVFRPTLKPKCYNVTDKILVYPKDELAGGTWIAASNQKRIACLLNGGFENHTKKANYTKSRGAIPLESFNYSSQSEFLLTPNLTDMEPFTLLLIDYENEVDFQVVVWDGKKNHITQVNNSAPGIWSSATLYSRSNRELRKKWFDEWIEKYRDDEERNILNFHTEKHSTDNENDILMKRNNALETVSISQISVKRNRSEFLYYDLKDHSKTKMILSDLPCTQVSQ